MDDKELCEMFGISIEDVKREVEKVEAGDYSSWDFSRVMMGNPIENEKLEVISTPVSESRIKAIKRITEKK